MKILIVEDRQSTIVGILDFCKDNKIDYTLIDNFDGVLNEVRTQQYDVLILDLKNDNNEHLVGKDIFDEIWSTCFIPIIVFSGHINALETRKNHKFISYYEKTQADKVEEKLREYQVLFPKIKTLKNEINQLFIEAIQAINGNDSDDIQMQRLIYNMRHYLDNRQIYNSQNNIKLPADIQLIDLPEYSNFLTCDIIQKIAENDSEEPEYYMIVSPSCEIEHSKTLLECKEIIKLKNEQIRGLKNRKNDGGHQHILFLPNNRFFGEMAVDCKKTKLIEKNKISKMQSETDINKYEYRKIFSIASPFRERMIHLCYSNRSRIGVPDIDQESWFKENENKSN